MDLPFAFTQLRLLTADGFIRAARERDVHFGLEVLEGLHRLRLITPFLRYQRDGRAIQAAKHDPHHARRLARWEPTWPSDLIAARAAGRLFDPRTEPFIARRRIKRRVDEISYASSEFLYAQHQVILLPAAQQMLPHLRYRGREVIGADVRRSWLTIHQGQARRLADTVLAVAALEARYYPDVVRSLRLGRESLEQYERWVRGQRLTEPLRWLGVTPDWLSGRATELLRMADRVDPLGEWLDLVREADPDRWDRLKGAARNAIDQRVAAEILLRYHDALVKGRRARRPTSPNRRLGSDLDGRLKPRGHLDDVLTRFGLSPHPRLIMVLEGATEMLIFPRVMRHFELRLDDEFIRLQDREGIDKDLAALVSYAVAPRTELEEDGGYLRLHRPVTSMLVVTDAERRWRSAPQRERHRQALIDRAVRTLPEMQRTRTVRDALETLIHVDVWHRGGLNFELAHFTDNQLADAILSLDAHGRHKHRGALIGHLVACRERRGNLDPLLGRISKVDLAEELWPVLERRIQRAQRSRTESKIPIVRVLDRALEVAHANPRRGVVIAVGPLR